MQELQDLCESKYRPLIEKALVGYVSLMTSHLDVPQVIPQIDFNLRGICRAAAAYGPTYKTPGGLISYNPLFFRVSDHVREQIESTTPHEYAHIVCEHLYPDEKGHGRFWKGVMLYLGVPPVRTHTMSIPEALVRPGFVYKCPNCDRTFEFSQRRHNNVVVRGKKYECTTCRRVLVLT